MRDLFRQSVSKITHCHRDGRKLSGEKNCGVLARKKGCGFISLKGWESGPLSPAFTLMEIMVVVVIIGLLAAFAVPSFQMMRRKVHHMLIANNLRQIWSAAQLYFLENGVDEVPINDLVWYIRPDGTLAKEAEESYTSVIKCICGEDYGALISIPRDTVDVQSLLATGIVWAAEDFSSPYTDGLTTANAAIIAVPRDRHTDSVLWFALRVDTGDLLHFSDLQKILDLSTQSNDDNEHPGSDDESNNPNDDTEESTEEVIRNIQTEWNVVGKLTNAGDMVNHWERAACFVVFAEKYVDSWEALENDDALQYPNADAEEAGVEDFQSHWAGLLCLNAFAICFSNYNKDLVWNDWFSKWSALVDEWSTKYTTYQNGGTMISVSDIRGLIKTYYSFINDINGINDSYWKTPAELGITVDNLKTVATWLLDNPSANWLPPTSSEEL